MLLSPVLASTYTRLAKGRGDISIASKFALGYVAVAVGFLIYAFSGRYAIDGRVSSWFMVWGYGLNSLGELLVSGLGLAMIARYIPARMSGFMMGAYFLATGISQYLGSVVANFAQVPSNSLPATQSLSLYTNLFSELGWLAVAGVVMSVLLLPLMRKLSEQHRVASSDALAASNAHNMAAG
jgi:proton-dependent oligopeptide transporter, POT family